MKQTVKALIIAVLITSCSGTKVFSDIDREADFETYKTYSWSSVEEPINEDYPQYDNTLNRRRWKNAIDTAMQREGYILVESNADLQVDYHIQFEHNAVIDHSNRSGESGYFSNIEPNAIYRYDEGITTIHIIDLKRDQLVWQGVLSKVLDINLLDKAETNIQEAVDKLFKKFTSQTAAL